MTGFILLAVFNGGVIGLSRILNGRLSQSKGPFIASFYNHLLGAFALLLLIILMGLFSMDSMVYSHVLNQPWYSYLGGAIGALYVAINSYIITKIGALKSTLFVVSGQILTGVILDINAASLVGILMQLAGVAFIILGVYLSMVPNKKQTSVKSTN